MTSPVTRTKLNWFGKNIELDFFADTKFEGRELITQIQAVFLSIKTRLFYTRAAEVIMVVLEVIAKRVKVGWRP